MTAATSTGPDLTFATQQVEALMDDQCVITAEPGPYGKTLGPDGSLISPPPVTRYEGKCYFSKDTTVPTIVNEGGKAWVDSGYRIAIPVGADIDLHVGDIVQATAARRDPKLVGRTFTIREITAKTFAVNRKCRLEERS
jgi:hypothetical protein